MTWQGFVDILPHLLTLGTLVFAAGMWRQREKATAEAMTAFGTKIDLMKTKIEETKDDIQEVRGQIGSIISRWEERDRWEERMQAIEDARPRRSPRRTRN